MFVASHFERSRETLHNINSIAYRIRLLDSAQADLLAVALD